MTRPRPLVPRGGSGRQRAGRRGVRRDRPRARPGRHGAGRRGGARGRRRRAADPRRPGRGDAPTSSSRAGTSGATGRRRRTSGTRRPRPTSPTSRRWAATATALLVGPGLPAEHPDGLAGGRRGRARRGVRAARAPPSSAGTWSRRRADSAVGGALRDRARAIWAAGRRCCGRARVPGDVVARRGAARAGRRAGWPCCAGGSAARSPWSRRTAVPPRRTRPGRPPRTPGRPRCATSATGCSPTSGTSPPTAGWSSTWTGRRSCAPASSPPGPLQQVGVGARRRPAGLGAHRGRGPRAGGDVPGRARGCPRAGR